MKTVYEKLTSPVDGKYYREWSIPEEMELGYDFTSIAPPSEMLAPRWDNTTQSWEENTETMLDCLQHQLADLQDIILSLCESEDK